MTHSVNSISALQAGFSSVTSLNDMHLLVNLGVTAEERHFKQEVSVSFKLFFKQRPKGCETDEIEDAICYFEISNNIKEYCKDKEFKLLEYMCNGLYKAIRGKIPTDIKIWLKIEKWPPIDGLQGSTSFEYTDIWE